MRTPPGNGGLVAAFPLSDTELALVCPQPVHPSMERTSRYRPRSGLAVQDVRIDGERPEQVVLQVEPMAPMPLTIDEVVIDDYKGADGKGLGRIISPRFVHGVVTPMELKVPHFEGGFPYTSKLVGVHASVTCCTGCNGGIHDRSLVVLNNHTGGG